MIAFDALRALEKEQKARQEQLEAEQRQKLQQLKADQKREMQQRIYDHARETPADFLQIIHFSWSKPGFGTIMMASFTVQNGEPIDV